MLLSDIAIKATNSVVNDEAGYGRKYWRSVVVVDDDYRSCEERDEFTVSVNMHTRERRISPLCGICFIRLTLF
jgi:hypothetical protein